MQRGGRRLRIQDEVELAVSAHQQFDLGAAFSHLRSDRGDPVGIGRQQWEGEDSLIVGHGSPQAVGGSLLSGHLCSDDDGALYVGHYSRDVAGGGLRRQRNRERP